MIIIDYDTCEGKKKLNRSTHARHAVTTCVKYEILCGAVRGIIIIKKNYLKNVNATCNLRIIIIIMRRRLRLV